MIVGAMVGIFAYFTFIQAGMPAPLAVFLAMVFFATAVLLILTRSNYSPW